MSFSTVIITNVLPRFLNHSVYTRKRLTVTTRVTMFTYMVPQENQVAIVFSNNFKNADQSIIFGTDQFCYSLSGTRFSVIRNSMIDC